MFPLQKLLFCTSVLLIGDAIYSHASCPKIVSRRDWGAASGTASGLDVNPPKLVILHHSLTPTCSMRPNCEALVHAIQNRHMKWNKYPDIAYNFLIGEDGNVYEGVGWGRRGTHDHHLSGKSIGVCIIGDYTTWLPNNAALEALDTILECGTDEGYLDADYRLLMHRQVNNSDCPGLPLYNHLKKWPHWHPSSNSLP